MNVVYGCCVGSWDKVTRNVLPQAHAEPKRNRRLITMYGYTSIAVAYNNILESVCGQVGEQLPDMLVLLHDDLEIIDDDAEDKFLAALHEEDVALVGVAGARRVKSLAWWDYDTVGHQWTDDRYIDFGAHTGDVNGIEGSIMVLSPWAIADMRFDTGYTGFHGYDCDMARAITAHGRRAVVVDVDTHHHTTVGWKSTAVHQSWIDADTRYRHKWEL